MHSDQLSLPGFTKPAAATQPKREKRDLSPSAEKRIREIEDRLFNLELEVTLLRENLESSEEDENE